MRLSDIKGEEAIEVLAEIIEPLAYIFADKEIAELAQGGNVPPVKYISIALKNHKSEVIEIMAKLEGKEVEAYKKTINVFTLPVQILAIVNDDTFKSLFTLQNQTRNISLASFGSAMESTEANEN